MVSRQKIEASHVKDLDPGYDVMKWSKIQNSARDSKNIFFTLETRYPTLRTVAKKKRKTYFGLTAWSILITNAACCLVGVLWSVREEEKKHLSAVYFTCLSTDYKQNSDKRCRLNMKKSRNDAFVVLMDVDSQQKNSALNIKILSDL